MGSVYPPPGFVSLREAVARVAHICQIPKEQAWRELRMRMYEGTLSGGYWDPAYKRFLHQTEAWRSPLNDNAVKSGFIIMEKGAFYREVALVSLSELEAFLSSGDPLGNGEPSRGEPAVKKMDIGRPSNPQNDDFWVEICRHLHEGNHGGPKQSQSAFVKAMVAWSSKHMETPYKKETIRKKIQHVWNALALGKKR